VRHWSGQGEKIMKCGTRVALAVGAGYLMGRRKKTGRAIMLAGAALAGAPGDMAGQLLRRGAKSLGPGNALGDVLGKVSPDLGDLGDKIRGDLLDAGKSSAVAVVSRRIEALSDQLRDRADSMRQAAGDGEGRTRRRPADEDLDEADDERQPETAREPAGAGRREAEREGAGHGPRRGPASVARRGGDEPAGTGDEAGAPVSPPRSPVRRPAPAQSPIRRTRR
jgi:hypothetical protein